MTDDLQTIAERAEDEFNAMSKHFEETGFFTAEDQELAELDLKLYTLQEVADILKVTRQTVYNYKRDGMLKCSKIGHDYRVSEQDLKDFLNNNK